MTLIVKNYSEACGKGILFLACSFHLYGLIQKSPFFVTLYIILVTLLPNLVSCIGARTSIALLHMVDTVFSYNLLFRVTIIFMYRVKIHVASKFE